MSRVAGRSVGRPAGQKLPCMEVVSSHDLKKLQGVVLKNQRENQKTRRTHELHPESTQVILSFEFLTLLDLEGGGRGV